jgi:hypothetical protein
MAMHYARRAVDLEDDPTSYGHVVARQVLGGALMGGEDVSEGITVLQDCWRSPARHQLSVLLVLQMAGHLAMILIAAGDLDGAHRVLREVHVLADTAEHAWGQGAAAALAAVQLAKARLVMATDPGASVPDFQRAVDFAEDWGWATMVLLALVGLALGSGSYIVALITKSEDALAPLLNGIAMPLLLLSGILLPMQIGPTWLQRLSDISPLKHVVTGVRALFRGEIDSSASLWGLFWVVLLTVIGLAVGARTFRKESA